MGVNVYTFGVCHCSVCAPDDMPPAEVIERANALHPTGLDHGWALSEEKFAGGQDNPCKCNHDDRCLHYLMVC